MSYAIRKDGQGWRAINSKDDLADGEVFSKDQPAPVESKVAAIYARLSAIDAATLRPLRAVYSGTFTDADTEKLAALEQESVTLRAELANL